MINYTEKGIGLHEAVRAAGHALRLENGAWIADDEAAVQAIIDGYTLADAKAARANEVDAYATRLRNKASRTTSAGEMALWAIKKAEADKFTSTSQPSDAPNLAIEAAQRGVALAALVAKVQANSDTVTRQEAHIAGIAGKHKDAMKALSDFASVAAYDFSIGWPAV